MHCPRHGCFLQPAISWIDRADVADDTKRQFVHYRRVGTSANLPTWRSPCSAAAFRREEPTKGAPAMSGLQQLSQSALEHPCEPRREGAGVGRTLTFQHARFVEQEMRSILLEGLIAVGELGQRHDELMARIDLED